MNRIPTSAERLGFSAKNAPSKKMTEKEIRKWWIHMADGDFSDTECSSALRDSAEVLPIQWLIDNWNSLYHEQAVLDDPEAGHAED